METNYNPLNQEFYMSNPDLEILFNDILKSFGKELQEIETEINLEKQKRANRIQSIKQVLTTASLLFLSLSFSSLSAKDLCSKKGPEELLRSSVYPAKFFFKHDCKKRKTYFSEEQARMVNDRLDKEIAISVKVNPDEYLVIVANRNGIIRTGKHDGLMTIWNEKSQLRLRQVGLAWK